MVIKSEISQRNSLGMAPSVLPSISGSVESHVSVMITDDTDMWCCKWLVQQQQILHTRSRIQNNLELLLGGYQRAIGSFMFVMSPYLC